MRILGIDYGEKRIGIAASDEDEKIAFEIGIVPADNFFNELPEIISQREIQKIVLGLPLNMSAKETEKTKEVRLFADQLKEWLKDNIPEIKFDFADERLSSQMASNFSGSQKNIDGLAAQVFLQNYLERQHNLQKK
jgi:putative Holliday junction resolvase